MPILRSHAALFHERRISSVSFTSALLYGSVYMRKGVARALVNSSDFGLMGEQSLQKWDISISLCWMPMNRRAKFHTASFTLGDKIRNCTNKRTNKHTNTQTCE